MRPSNRVQLRDYSRECSLVGPPGSLDLSIPRYPCDCSVCHTRRLCIGQFMLSFQLIPGSLRCRLRNLPYTKGEQDLQEQSSKETSAKYTMAAKVIWKIPFDATQELYHGIQMRTDESKRRVLEAPGKHALPGNSFVSLDGDDIIQHLTESLLTKDLDVFTPYLILVSTPASSSITPLHQQAAFGRSILVNSSAELHLVWYHDRIFIKPLPECLLSYAFWAYLFEGGQPQLTDEARLALYKAAVGFVRTYAYLIRDELDFELAIRHKLIPPSVDVQHYVEFIRRFAAMPNDASSPRYKYGELRLSRLNFWAPIALARWDYFNTKRQSDSYFTRYFSPLLFMFALVSVLLSAMQVALAAQQLPSSTPHSWVIFTLVCKWTSIVALIAFAAAAISLAVIFMSRLLSELSFALGLSRRRRLEGPVGD